MNFELTQQQAAIQETARKFAQEELLPGVLERDANSEFPVEQFHKMGELGLVGLPYPKEVGGQGADYLSYVLAVEEISKVDASMGIGYSVVTSLYGGSIMNSAAPVEKKREFLEEVLSGKCFGSFGLTEPNVATVFIVAVGFWLWLKRGNNRHRFHAMLLRVALIGPLICAINSARYLRTLSILQSSGVPLLDGMNLSTESLNNLEIRQRLANAAENVRQGNSIHLSLEQTAIFPPMMLYMVASGEKSGQLGTLMVRAADNQETLQQNRIALTLSIFEPALIITMALIVLFIVVSVLQPLLQLNSMIN